MIECFILGDSIALGVHQHRQECVAYAHVGWSSHRWNRAYLDKDLSAQIVVISLGSNDWSDKVTKFELTRLRATIRAGVVFWILPAIKPEIRNVVREVADMHGDLIVPIEHLSPDGIHPTSYEYKELARKVK